MMYRISLVALGVLMLPTLARADNWPQFRGPHSSASADKIGMPDEWSTQKNVRWIAAVAGHGWSSPVVCGDRVFLTAVIKDKTPEPRPGLYIQDLTGKIPPREHRLMGYCLDPASGQMPLP